MRQTTMGIKTGLKILKIIKNGKEINILKYNIYLMSKK